MAEGYVRFWAPVLRDAAEHVLEHLEPAMDEALGQRAGRGDRAARLLDVGSGTGTLALAAIDPSGGMLDVARRTVAANLAPEAAALFEPVVASADALPGDLGPFDAAMSSFVLQLVPSRA